MTERILHTGYGLLHHIGAEEPGYGLYSYAILVKHGDRSTKFLDDVVDVIGPVEGLHTPHSQLNLLSIPSKIPVLLGSGRSRTFFADYYDYSIAQELLDHICNQPAETVKVCDPSAVTVKKVFDCESRGPFIFTYAQPASKLALLPSPFLFIDLSNTDEGAFPVIIDAFKAQVQREDFSDCAKINTLKNRFANITYMAANLVVPVSMAVFVAIGQSQKDKK